MARVSLPKNFQQARDWKALRPMLLEMATKLETFFNNSTQIYVQENTGKLDSGIRRLDLVFRILELEGADSLGIYWWDGEELQPLKFNAIGGLIDPSQIDNFDFLHLTDTPNSYAGAGNYFVRVTSAADGLEFYADSSVGTGTVTSVAATTNDSSTLGITGSPITTSGTLAFTIHDDLVKFVQAASWAVGTSLLNMTSTLLHIAGIKLADSNRTINSDGEIDFVANIGEEISDGPVFDFRTTLNAPLSNDLIARFQKEDTLIPLVTDLWSLDTSGNTKNLNGGAWDSSNRSSFPGNPSSTYIRSFWKDGSFYGRDSAGNNILVGPGVASAAYFVRDSTSVTTASIADGSTDNVDISCGKYSHLLKVDTDVPAWVRFYTDTSARTTDSSRLITEDPSAGVGVLAEFITTSGQLSIKVSPSASVDSLESTPLTTVPIAVTNRSGSTDTVTVTVTKIRIE